MPAGKKRSRSAPAGKKGGKGAKVQKRGRKGKADEPPQESSSYSGATESETEKIGVCGSHHIGVYTDDAGDRLAETTYEMDYRLIALGKALPWFMKFVAEQEKGEYELPQESHGFSKVLTNVHRAHPNLVYSWEDPPAKPGGPPVFRVYTIKSWESAGLWCDSEGTACLVIRATYREKGQAVEHAVHMLYEAQRRESAAAIEAENAGDLWAVTSVGQGKHLKLGAGGKIVCDNPCKAPPKPGK